MRLAPLIGLAAVLAPVSAFAQGAPPPPPPAASAVPPPPPPLAQLEPPPPPFDAYVLVGGEQRGPLSVDAVEALVRDGGLRVETYAWLPGMAAWRQAGSIPELADIIAATPAPPPPIAYYVAVRGRTAGPFDLAALSQRVAAGAMTPETLVFGPGMSGWEPAATRADLATLFGPQSTIAPTRDATATTAEPERAQASDAAGTAAAAEQNAATAAPSGSASEAAAASSDDSAPGPDAAAADAAAADTAAADAAATGAEAADAVAAPETGAAPDAASARPDATDAPAVATGTPDAAAVAAVGGRWSATRTATIDGVGDIVLDLSIDRRPDGTAKVEGRGRGTSDAAVSVVLQGDLAWLASPPRDGRVTISQRGDLAVMVRRPGKPTERRTVTEDVAAQFEIEADGSLKDSGDATVWTRN